jgi:outer membrane protein TolC
MRDTTDRPVQVRARLHVLYSAAIRRTAACRLAAAIVAWAAGLAGVHAQSTAQASATAAWPRVVAQPAPQPPRVLSLDAALALADETSEVVTIAEAGVTRAESDERRARSEWLPQLSAFASYDRALASEFEGIFDSAGPPCTPFTLDPAAPLDDRVAEIERALRDCPPTGDIFGGGGTGGDGEDRSLPFGRANTYRLNLAFSQNVYAGGRLAAQLARARLGRTSAALGVRTTRAQLALDVAQAYFDAVLSERLLVIAEATLAQAEQTAAQVQQQREAGRMAEFDLLRAQVTRDNQRPEVIRRGNARDVAHLRLKQLLEIPLDTPLQLEANLEADVLPVPATRFAQAVTAAESGADTRVRTVVTQAENDVQQRQEGVRIARAQRLPAVSISSSYGRVAYPSTVPSFGDFRTNWTIGASAQVPLFTGGRLKADEMAARADLTETQARLQLTRELATLDQASARLELANARAAWEATSGTVQQATRAHEIAELRYREGLSTQLELSDARLLLQQAQTARAQAARDVQIARVRLALLPDLPLPAGNAVQQAQGALTAAPQAPPATNVVQPAAPGASPGTAGAAAPGTGGQ